jgi:uncharacterized protein (DUF697 family)
MFHGLDFTYTAPMAGESQDSEATIKKYMYWSMGAGLIPIPALDVAAVMAIQVNMVAALADAHGQAFSREAGRAFVAALVCGSLPTAMAGPVARLLKAIPLIGQTAGALAMPALAGASTYAVGKVFVQHFESGGTFRDFDPEAARGAYAGHLGNARSAVGT